MDLVPEGKGILEKNFFSYKPQENFSNCLVVGNPPFGQQATLAIEFFRHAATFANTIAFILPRSFKKVSIQNRLPLEFHLVKEILMEDNAFTLNDNDYSVPCVFQVWEKREYSREKISFPLTTSLFTFTKDTSVADFRVQRVGGNAGKAFLDKNGATSSNYYLTNTSNLETKELVEIINSINFPSVNDTVGPKSLPKGEFIYEVETLLSLRKK